MCLEMLNSRCNSHTEGGQCMQLDACEAAGCVCVCSGAWRKEERGLKRREKGVQGLKRGG